MIALDMGFDVIAVYTVVSLSVLSFGYGTDDLWNSISENELSLKNVLHFLKNRIGGYL